MSIRRIKKEYGYEDFINYFAFDEPEDGDKIAEFCYHYWKIGLEISDKIIENFTFEYCSQRYNIQTKLNHFHDAVDELLESYKICESICKSAIRKRLKYIMLYPCDINKFSRIKATCKNKLEELRRKENFNYTNDIVEEISLKCKEYYYLLIDRIINNIVDDGTKYSVN